MDGIHSRRARGRALLFGRMTTVNGHQVVRLEFTSAFEMLDFVQVVSDHMGRGVGLDDDAVHWVGVAIRESVINAIKHGNRNDATKRVFVEFETASPPDPPGLLIRVRDQGAGSDPASLANPLDPGTDVDIAVERMFRDLVADRFPDHQVLGEELGGSAAAPPGPCWVFDPIDGTVNYAHGLPIFCASLAFEIDGVAEVAAIYD